MRPIATMTAVLSLSLILMTPCLAQPREHRVEAGDTLSGIALRYQVSLDELKQANYLEDDLIRIGQKLSLPMPTLVQDGDIKLVLHLVTPGENLSVIARRYQCTVRAIRLLNLIEDDQLVVGQRLRIPTDAVVPQREAFQYTVKLGDTLTRIAAKHSLESSEIRRLNAGTRWDQLQVGAQLSLYRELPIETRPNVAVIPAPESEAKLVEKVAEKIADKAAATTLESLRDQKTLPQSLNVLNREQESLKPINDETPAEPEQPSVTKDKEAPKASTKD